MTAFLDTLIPVLPEVLVTITACVVLVADGLLPRGQSRGVLPAMTVVGLALAFLGGPLAPPSGQYFGGFVQIDTFTTFFRAVFIVLAVFATLVAPSYLDRRGIPPGEYYATICFSTVGAMTIALSTDLITLFVGLELMTIPIYVLAGMQRRDAIQINGHVSAHQFDGGRSGKTGCHDRVFPKAVSGAVDLMRRACGLAGPGGSKN